jgi:hypothetical protein
MTNTPATPYTTQISCNLDSSGPSTQSPPTPKDAYILLTSILYSTQLFKEDCDPFACLTFEDYTWDALAYHGHYQNRVFSSGALQIKKMATNDMTYQTQSESTLYHICSIFIDMSRHKPPGHKFQCTFSCNALVQVNDNESTTVCLFITSGQTHESCIIDLQTCQAAFAANPALSPPSQHFKTVISSSLQQIKPALLRLLNDSSELTVSPSFNHAFCPVATRPFLTINDYMVAVSHCLNGFESNNVTLFDTGTKTFLDYSKIQFNSNSFNCYKTFSSVSDVNHWLLHSRTWLHVPTSLDSDSSTWKSLSDTVHSIDISFQPIINHLDELATILPFDPLDLGYSLNRDKDILKDFVDNGLVIILDLAAEKRSWLDQLEAYKMIIESQHLQNIKTLICIDGSTKVRLGVGPQDYRLTQNVGAKFRHLVDSLSKDLISTTVIPIFGLDYMAKSVFYINADYFLVQLGTASIGVSKAFNRIGRLVGPRSIMENPLPALYSSNGMLVSPELIVNEPTDDSSLPWDKTSYRIIGYESIIDNDIMKLSQF